MTMIRVKSVAFDNEVMRSVEAARHVVGVLKDGGLAVVPLDVSYAFLAASQEALARIFELKLRPAAKRCSILASLKHFLDAADTAPEPLRRMQRVVDAGFPLGILVRPDWESDTVTAIPKDCVDLLLKDEKLALFINMGAMSTELIEAAEKAGIQLFGSSANISGSGNSFTLDEVPAALLEAADAVCEGGTCRYANPERLASTIVDLDTSNLTRRGALHEEIERLLKMSDNTDDHLSHDRAGSG